MGMGAVCVSGGGYWIHRSVHPSIERLTGFPDPNPPPSTHTPPNHQKTKTSAYEALQLFGSQAKRRAKDGEPQAGIGVALEGTVLYTCKRGN